MTLTYFCVNTHKYGLFCLFSYAGALERPWQHNTPVPLYLSLIRPYKTQSSYRIPNSSFIGCSGTKNCIQSAKYKSVILNSYYIYFTHPPPSSPHLLSALFLHCPLGWFTQRGVQRVTKNHLDRPIFASSVFVAPCIKIYGISAMEQNILTVVFNIWNKDFK